MSESSDRGFAIMCVFLSILIFMFNGSLVGASYMVTYGLPDLTIAFTVGYGGAAFNGFTLLQEAGTDLAYVMAAGIPQLVRSIMYMRDGHMEPEDVYSSIDRLTFFVYSVIQHWEYGNQFDNTYENEVDSGGYIWYDPYNETETSSGG